jgi:competence ComEA-like helix-hairpin-helix protein
MRAASILGAIIAGSMLVMTAAARQRRPPAQPVDLNRATAVELQQIPGIGPRRAAAIVRFRQKSGPFRRVEDLLAIRGFSTRMLEKIRPYVVVRPLSDKDAKSAPAQRSDGPPHPRARKAGALRWPGLPGWPPDRRCAARRPPAPRPSVDGW